MAGTVEVISGYPRVNRGIGGRSTIYGYTLTADASGDVSITQLVTSLAGTAGIMVRGDLTEVRFVAGTAAAGRDIYIYDRSDTLKTDLLGGAGVNIVDGSVVPEGSNAIMSKTIDGALYVVAAAMGNGGVASIFLVVEN